VLDTDTELYAHIQETPLVDSHEHLASEAEYLEGGKDVLRAVFPHYTISDLWAAGASKEALDRLQDVKDPDVAARFEGVREAWERIQYTGYGDASCLVAGEIYGIDEMTGEAFALAQANLARPEPGDRLALLKDQANLDHVQIDAFSWTCEPDPAGPDFFLHDLSVYPFAAGEPNLSELYTQFNVQVSGADSLREAIAAVFDRNGPRAIAVKTQHAYARTLSWQDRTDAEADLIVRKLAAGLTLDESEKLCLGDWCLARSMECAERHGLPVKIHTGYMAGNDVMDLDRTRPSKLCSLISKFPGVRFVLMHTGYPYGGELASMAKHFRNVYADLCWAWAVDPLSTVDFVRRMIHTCPTHKLFAFGGDTFYPEATVAFAVQAREGLTKALQAEIDAGVMAEPAAIKLALRFMQRNQYECFDVVGRRRALGAAAG